MQRGFCKPTMECNLIPLCENGIKKFGKEEKFSIGTWKDFNWKIPLNQRDDTIIMEQSNYSKTNNNAYPVRK